MVARSECQFRLGLGIGGNLSAELVGVAQPAMRRALARRSPGQEPDSRSRHAAGTTPLFAENTAEGSDDLSTAVQMTEIIGLPDASHLI
jgi:hypothetical protein